MTTFLKTILIVLLVYFGLKILFRLAMPYILRYISKKAGQKMEQAFQRQYGFEQQTGKKEGKITVDKVPRKESRGKKPVGEYVDYEEID